MSDPIIGIDLGTTNSVAAHTDHAGITSTITGVDGDRIVPSVVHFPADGSAPLVGESAKQYAVVDPARTASLFKRGMGGKTFTENGQPFVVDGTEWTPEMLSGLVLKKLADAASHHLGTPVSRVVITVPAYFGDPERAATKTAGKLAGLDVVRVVNEPTAAAIAHGVQDDTSGRVLVFDLGGGTFDVTVMDRGPDGALEVLFTSGDHRLGGADFDALILDAMAAEVQTETGVDIRSESWMLAEAKAKAEEMKIELSKLDTSTRPLSTGGRPVMFTLTREEFEAMLAQTLQDVEDMVVATAEKAGMAMADIDVTLMVGGSSRIPAFQALLRRLTGKEPKLSRNMDEDVARGASILAVKSVEGALDSNAALALLPAPIDAASHGLGLTVLSGETHTKVNQVMIRAGSPVPARAEQVFSVRDDNQRTIRVTLNEGDTADLEFVRPLGETIGDFNRGVRRGHPVKVVMEYTADQRVKVSARDGETDAHLCELEVAYESAMSDAAQASATDLLATMTVR